MAGLDYTLLPPEIWREILGRVSVKSVLRCRSVCKSWYSLVSCPDFISHHSLTNQHDQSGNRVLFHLLDIGTGASSFRSHDMDVESAKHDDDHSHDQYRLLGSCNGLICLFKNYYRDGVCTVTFLFWNPAIRKIVHLPSLTYSSPRLAYPSCVGFGFDSNISDYKVMCNLRFLGSLEEIFQRNACQIIDLSNGVWRSISPLLPSQNSIHPQAECYVNGALHWSQISDRILSSFNMSDECFREIRMPDCAEFAQNGDDALIKTRCVTFGGLLHVIVWKIDREEYDVDMSESCSVWAMKEYGVTESWIKVSTVDLRSAQVLPSTLLFPEKFIFWAKGEILMVPEGNMQWLVLYNTESGECKHLFSTTKYVQNLCLYKESLTQMLGER